MKQIILAASLCAGLPLAALAQAATPPDDGYSLREVRELTFAPLPGGGLLPYRQGEWWGYADSTGRVVITPGLVLGTLFPAAGLLRADHFLAETEDEARKKRQIYQSYPPDLYAYYDTQPQPRAFLNSTGEVLRVAADEAAVLLPGGRLRAVRRSEVRAGQMELLDVAPLEQVEKFGYLPKPATPFITRRLAAPRVEQQRVAEVVETSMTFGFLKHDVARLGTAQNLKIKPLGVGYYAVGPQTRVFERRAHGDSHHSGWRRGWGPETGLVALANQRGRILTPFEYDYIDNFTTNHRWTVASRPAKTRRDTTGHTGLLGRRGQEVLPFVHNMVSPLPGGGALTRDWPSNDQQRPNRYGLLDARGRWRLRPQTSLTSPDEAGYLRHHRTLAPGDTVVEFLTQRGRPAFRARPALRQAAGFERGRAWVRTDLGPGLLDARGRWVVPPGRYEQILSMDETDGYGLQYQGQAWDRPAALDLVMASAFDELFERRAVPHATPPDTTYLMVRQGGRFGLIRRATGAVVVPCRYEAITCWSGQYGTGRRDGQDYVLAARTGGELLPGQYRGEWYRFPGGPRLLQVYRDRQPNRWYSQWLVADTSGRALTPEFTRVGYDNYLTPDDWAAVLAPPGPPAAAATADSTSFPLLPRPVNSSYSGLMPWFHTGPGGAASSPLTPSGAYRRTLPGGGERLLVYRAGRLRYLTGHTYYALELLAGGWHHGRTAERPDLLISPIGQEYAPPPDLRWNIFYHAIGRVVPFANGTAAATDGPSSQPLLGDADQEGGLVTRGGTLLWDTGQRRKRR